MRNEIPIIPQAGPEQFLTVEQQEQIDEAYFSAYRSMYPKVFDAMDYTAYIASCHEPAIVIGKIARFYEKHKILFMILGAIGLINYLLLAASWVMGK